jgi:hypothetical protein
LEDIRKTGKGRRHIKGKRLKDVFDQLDDTQSAVALHKVYSSGRV